MKTDENEYLSMLKTVSLRTNPKISDEDRKQIESRVHTVLTQEIDKIQTSGSRTESEPRFNVCLKGLGLPEIEAGRIESKILEVLRAEVTESAKKQDIHLNTVSLCSQSDPAARKHVLADFRLDNKLEDNDIITWDKFEGTVGPNEIEVGLQTSVAVNSAKAIQQFNCGRVLAEIKIEPDDPGSQYMRFDASQMFALVFREFVWPQWWSSYFLYKTSELIGNTIFFTWQKDK